MSKYDRYKKSADGYIFPHKHCKRCGQMIEEAFTYCSDCYKKIKEKKRRRISIFKRKNKEEKEYSE